MCLNIAKQNTSDNSKPRAKSVVDTCRRHDKSNFHTLCLEGRTVIKYTEIEKSDSIKSSYANMANYTNPTFICLIFTIKLCYHTGTNIFCGFKSYSCKE